MRSEAVTIARPQQQAKRNLEVTRTKMNARRKSMLVPLRVCGFDSSVWSRVASGVWLRHIDFVHTGGADKDSQNQVWDKSSKLLTYIGRRFFHGPPMSGNLWLPYRMTQEAASMMCTFLSRCMPRSTDRELRYHESSGEGIEDIRCPYLSAKKYTNCAMASHS